MSYIAWRELGGVGVRVLFEVGSALCEKDSKERLREFLPDGKGGHTYKDALMVFIPKGPSGQHEGRDCLTLVTLALSPWSTATTGW